jgi:hypothetical protein
MRTAIRVILRKQMLLLAVDVVVAVGLLQLAPKKVTPRVTGALGFITSLISCYQVCTNEPRLLPSRFLKN